MAIVAKYGKPDLFITFTCNPKWDEVIKNVKPWEEHFNRVDLICRVFREKLKAFIDDIRNKKNFGDVTAFVYVIEFQKRGMPHNFSRKKGAFRNLSNFHATNGDF